MKNVIGNCNKCKDHCYVEDEENSNEKVAENEEKYNLDNKENNKNKKDNKENKNNNNEDDM